jgi:predicted transcriptional regulator of viral defense system
MRTLGRTVDRDIARLASRSHGVVTRAELIAVGISPEQIGRRARRGALIRVHRGVYRVGHAAPSPHALYLAAVRACGPDAVLAGIAAAWLWEIVRRTPPAPEVTAPTERRVPGVRCRRCRSLTRQDSTVRSGIPVTTLPRTLVDLAACLAAPALARAAHEAQVKHRLQPAQIEECLALHRSSPGAAELRRVLHGGERVTLSELESRFLAVLRANDLPLPLTNRPFGNRRLDCRWPAHRLVVELDSYRYHRSRHAWEEDRRRERLVRARGDEFRRYTWGDVVEAPAHMLRELTRLLSGNE